MPDLLSALPHFPRRILVLGCSATKSNQGGMIAAFRRYDGPAYRVLRKHYSGMLWEPNKLNELKGLSVYVLSAKHGLRPAYGATRYYDQRMTPEIAKQWMEHGSSAARFRTLLNADPRLYVVAGAQYRAVIDAWVGPGRYQHASGGIGQQLGQLKAWLVGVAKEFEARKAPTGTQFELFQEAA